MTFDSKVNYHLIKRRHFETQQDINRNKYRCSQLERERERELKYMMDVEKRMENPREKSILKTLLHQHTPQEEIYPVIMQKGLVA